MGLSFKNISHSYGAAKALSDVNLLAEAGEILCLLGPSGCGKTTLLNLAAGILNLQDGEIHLEDALLVSPANCPPPEKRPVGLVFQEGALFPHMTVRQNIAFGISNRPERDHIVDDLLDQIGLAGFGDRFPHTLSGGQQQRVAVARALAPYPPVLLMDEPFANIDIAMRRRLREDIRRVLKARNCVTIMVTHDPEEAMEISDKIAIMENGHIVQTGRPSDVFRSPRSLSVAQLTCEGTVVTARRENDKLVTGFGSWPVSSLQDDDGSDDFYIYLRAGTVLLREAQNTADTHALSVTDVRHTGLAQIITLISDAGDSLTLQFDPDPDWSVGQRVILEPKTGQALSFRV